MQRKWKLLMILQQRQNLSTQPPLPAGKSGAFECSCMELRTLIARKGPAIYRLGSLGGGAAPIAIAVGAPGGAPGAPARTRPPPPAAAVELPPPAQAPNSNVDACVSATNCLNGARTAAASAAAKGLPADDTNAIDRKSGRGRFTCDVRSDTCLTAMRFTAMRLRGVTAARPTRLSGDTAARMPMTYSFAATVSRLRGCAATRWRREP